MKRKLVLAATGLLAMFTLSACSNNSAEIATMKGGKITVQDFFDQVKNSSSSKNTVTEMIVLRAFEDQYGKDITDKDVQKEYEKNEKLAEEQGTTLKEYFSQSGLTEESFKKSLRQNLAFTKGLDANIKLTDEDLEAAWKTFHPEVEAQIIVVSSEDEAKDIKKQLDDKGDFTKIAKEKSVDSTTKEDGGKIKFDSQSSDVPSEVKEKAFALKNNEISDPIEVMDSTYQTTSYYIVKMVKSSSKGNEMKPYKKEVEEIAKETKKSDSSFTAKVISDTLKKANVKIKDETFKDVLSGYILSDESSSDSSEAEETEDTKSSDTNESSTEETEDSETTESSSSEE